MILGVVSIGISGTTEKPCNDETYALFADVTKYVEWIKREVGDGYRVEMRMGNTPDDADQDINEQNLDGNFQNQDVFCEFVIDDG